MGVSGSGKTTVGKLFAQQMNYIFLDADDFHPPENISKMQNAIPLTDEDRFPWLKRLNHELETQLKKNSVVLACSALKESYRKILMQSIQHSCEVIYLKGNYETLEDRLQQRKGHYMPASLLQSQLNTLQEPTGALTLDILSSPATQVNKIIDYFHLK